MMRLGRRRRHVVDGTAALSAISPSLGDTYAGTPLLLTGTNLSGVTSVTIGGTECTSVVATETTVRCYAPAKAAGSYDVIATAGAVTSTLAGAYEAWHPAAGITSGTARIYESTLGVTDTGGLVDTWADQGTGAKDVTGATARRPHKIANVFGENNKPALRFIKTDDSNAGDVLNLASPIQTQTGYSKFWVGKQIVGNITGSGGGTIVRSDPARVAALSAQYATIAHVAQVDAYNADSGLHYYSGTQYNDGASHVVGRTHNGSTGDLKYYEAGAQLGATVTGATFGTTRAGWAGIGNSATMGTDPLDADLACVVVVEAVITPTEAAKLSQWMFGKFIARSYAFHRVSITTTWTARDGAALVALGTDLYMLGGWNGEVGGTFNGDTRRVTNEVWKSTNSGATWSLILAGDYTYSSTINGANSTNTRWTPRHMSGAFAIGTTMYVIGSDPFNDDDGSGGSYVTDLSGTGTADVWSSTDGITWTLVTSSAGWGPRVNHMVGVIGTTMYVMGGQTNCNDDSTALNDVWRSTDGGANWTQLADAPWSERGLVGHFLPTMAGRIYVIGGGTYGSVSPPGGSLMYGNDVWSFDGSNWVEVSADGAAAFSKRRYHMTVAWDDKLWVFNGWGPLASPANIGDCWSSPDGVTWTEQTMPSWRTSHADGVCVLGDSIVLGPGNGNIGQGSTAGVAWVFKVVRNGVSVT